MPPQQHPAERRSVESLVRDTIGENNIAALGRAARGADDFVRGVANGLTFGGADVLAGHANLGVDQTVASVRSTLGGNASANLQTSEHYVRAERERTQAGGDVTQVGVVAGSLMLPIAGLRLLQRPLGLFLGGFAGGASVAVNTPHAPREPNSR